MFERMETAESIYEGVVKPSYFKKIPRQIPTVLIAARIIEDNPPCKILAPQQEKAW